MSIQDKIAELREKAALLEAKKVKDTDFSDNMDQDFDNDIDNDADEDDHDTKNKKDNGDARKDTNDIEDEDESKGFAKGKAVKEATDPNQKQAAVDQDENLVGKSNAKIKRKLTGQDPKPTGPSPVKEAVKIDLGSLFDGTELTEEFKEKATTIFEAAVAARVVQEVELIENELAQMALDESEELKEGLIEKVDGYLDFMVEQWIKDNEVALERGIKAEIFESFIGQMRDVFVEHSITLPDDEFDLVESLQDKTEALEQTLDEQVAQNIELTKTIKQYAKQASIAEATEGMTDIDAEKFSLLAEEINFDDEESFAKKLTVIRENYIKPAQKEAKQLSEDVTQGSNEPINEVNESTKIDPNMKQYLTAFK